MQALGAYYEDSDEDISPRDSASSRSAKGKEKMTTQDDEKLSVTLHHTTGTHKSRPNSSAVRNAIVDGSVQILRRSAGLVHLHPRTHSSSSVTEPSNSRTDDTSQDALMIPKKAVDLESESLAEIRACLLPPPIPGVQDWNIPPPTDEPCDPSLKAKLDQFFELKRGNPPKHFNDSLMSNRSFRNPHLYAKLVEFVDVDEKCSNIPKGSWDLGDLSGWDAEKIASTQKEHYEQQSTGQTPGKRTRIGFTSEGSRHDQFQESAGLSRKDRRDHRYNPYSTAEVSKVRSSTRWR